MSQTTDGPESRETTTTVTVEVKMVPPQPSHRKIALAALALVLYIYFLCFIKAAYVKTLRIERIFNMAAETEKIINGLRIMDYDLGLQLQELEELEADT